MSQSNDKKPTGNNNNNNNRSRNNRRRHRRKRKLDTNNDNDDTDTKINAVVTEHHGEGNAPCNAFVSEPPAATDVTATATATAAGELWWELRDDSHRVPLKAEEDILPALLRWKRKERQMMKDQPPFRMDILCQHLRKANNNNTIPLEAALSLRRTHMKNLNPRLPMHALKLGRDEDIRRSAELFEQAVETYLKQQNVVYIGEKEQKRQAAEAAAAAAANGNGSGTSSGSPLTPDFRLSPPVILKTYRRGRRRQQHPNNNSNTAGDGYEKQILEEECQIHWIEVKMFYGASTIPNKTPNAVGTILPKMEKYVNAYGPGAIIFLQGCGDRFADQLAELGVTALSGSGGGLSPQLLQPLRDHQRTWCADENGQILP